MRRWFDLDWYRYLSARVRRTVPLFVALPVLAALGVGGFLVVSALATTPKAEEFVRVKGTVEEAVKVVQNGRVVTKRVPVVKTVYAKPVTVTQTVRLPDGTTVVRPPVVRYQPVYRRKLVYVKGKPVTVSRVVTDKRTLTETQQLTVEQTSFVTNTNTITRPTTITQPTTVTRRRTDSVTVTGPGSTVTVPVTVTHRTTVTGPESTVTVTGPTKTVTVTTTG
jgi:hypothetical protein